jgi:hypothetical protein
MHCIYIGESSLDDRSAQVFPYNIVEYILNLGEIKKDNTYDIASRGPTLIVVRWKRLSIIAPNTVC